MIAEVLLQFQEYQFLFLEIINSIMDITGLRGYNIANIMIFILVQPILTLVFLILWLREKKNRYK